MAELTDTQLDDLITALRLERPRRGPGSRAACGTPGGYNRHVRAGETACAPCRTANTEAKRGQRATTPLDQLAPIPHGEERGAKQHRYRGVSLCEPCRRAELDGAARRRAARKANR